MEPALYASPGGAVGSAVVDQLARTKGWTRFFSVLCWIGAGFLILGGLVMMLFGLLAGGTAGSEDDNVLGGVFGGLIGGLFLGGFYFVMAFFYIYPALKLWKFSSRVDDLMEAPSESILVIALNEQRSFWKYVGVLMIIGIAINIAVVVSMIAFMGIAGMAAFAAAAAAGGG